MLRRAQTTDLRSLGVQSSVNSAASRVKTRPNPDDEDIPPARTAAIADPLATSTARSATDDVMFSVGACRGRVRAQLVTLNLDL